MNKIKIISIILTIVFITFNLSLLASCTGEKVSEKKVSEPLEVRKIAAEEADEMADGIDKQLITANTDFSFKIFNQLAEEDAGENIFISPYSISTALAMTYNGAEGDTKDAMAKTLEFNGIPLDGLNEGFYNLMLGILNADEDVELNIANSIWYKEDYDVKEDFLERNREYYRSVVNEIDFSDPGAVDTINGWISDATKGKIDKMISNIGPAVVMYLINAIYFKGGWTHEFDEENTEEKDFHGLDSTSKVEMMYQQNEFGYYEGDSFSAVKLPYGQEKFSMYVILPDEGVGVDSVAQGFDSSSWDELISSYKNREIKLSMPRFEMEYGIKELNEALNNLGMGVAFSESADFSGINPNIFISRVLHKAVIEVNEKGSEAAAATVVEAVESAMPAEEIIEFNVTRPFIFIIADDRNGSILFMGKAINL
ncbi:MAG: serpin family protein [Candidatus Humimicrobiaceae bacterium]